jgi:hypothetical protein
VASFLIVLLFAYYQRVYHCIAEIQLGQKTLAYPPLLNSNQLPFYVAYINRQKIIIF